MPELQGTEFQSEKGNEKVGSLGMLTNSEKTPKEELAISREGTNTENQFTAVENVLTQMQANLAEMKLTKQSQDKAALQISELTLLLAEAQEEEIQLSERMLVLKTEWHDLTNNINDFQDLNVSGN